MEQTNLEVRKKIDWHFNRKDFSGNADYAEFSFCCCFYEVFNIAGSVWATSLNGDEIFEVFRLLDIKVELDFLERKYSDSSNHDVEVFHSAKDEQVFAYLDLQKEPTDQNDMFFLGIRCARSGEDIIHRKLLDIYIKLKTASPFMYDIWNHSLYYKVFLSYFYFYGNEYTGSKRQLNHHSGFGSGPG